METALDDTDGRAAGLGAPSRAVEAVRHLGLPGTEELCLTGLRAVLGPEGGGGRRLDCQHQSGERLLPGAAPGQLYHRQPAGRLRASLLREILEPDRENFTHILSKQME